MAARFTCFLAAGEERLKRLWSRLIEGRDVALERGVARACAVDADLGVRCFFPTRPLAAPPIPKGGEMCGMLLSAKQVQEVEGVLRPKGSNRVGFLFEQVREAQDNHLARCFVSLVDGTS